MGIFKFEFSVILIILWGAIAITFTNFRYKKISRFKNRNLSVRITSSTGNIIYSLAMATLIISIPFVLLL